MAYTEAPDTPDYKALATQQGALNKQAAIDTAGLNRPNTVTPFGTSLWSYDPTTGRFTNAQTLQKDTQTALSNLQGLSGAMSGGLSALGQNALKGLLGPSANPEAISKMFPAPVNPSLTADSPDLVNPDAPVIQEDSRITPEQFAAMGLPANTWDALKNYGVNELTYGTFEANSGTPQGWLKYLSAIDPNRTLTRDELAQEFPNLAKRKSNRLMEYLQQTPLSQIDQKTLNSMYPDMDTNMWRRLMNLAPKVMSKVPTDPVVATALNKQANTVQNDPIAALTDSVLKNQGTWTDSSKAWTGGKL